MRLSSFLLILLACFGFTEKSNSQNARVSLNKQHVMLEEVLEEIEQQTDYLFISNREVNVKTEVSVEAKNQSVKEVLDKIFTNTNIYYSMEGINIILSKRLSTGVTPAEVQQQKRTITGVVLDDYGEPVIGATVVEKGTSNGVITDADGKFSLKVPENAILQISYIGYVSQEVSVGEKMNFTITLKENIQSLDEVVVIGYGTQKRQAITGSVAQADLKTYEKVPVNNIMETLKGSVAGLNVGESNKAGYSPGFTIRGRNTIAASQYPLIVLDGIIYSGSMNDINPADIESVTVLKDASAVAVFGARSANGVIMIETKKGKSIEGKPRFTFESCYGVVNELKRPEMYDAKGYLKRMYDILNGSGTKVTMDEVPNYLQEIEKKNYDATPDHIPTLTDPYGLLGQMGYNFNTTLSVSQRTEKTNYYLSFNQVDQRGVIQNDMFKRYSVRANFDARINDWLKIGLRTFYSYRNYPRDAIYGATGNGGSVYLFSPYASVYNEDGRFNKYPQSTTSFPNPFLSIATESNDRLNNLNGVFTGRIDVPWVKGLSYTINYSQTLISNETSTFYSKATLNGATSNGQGERKYSRRNTELIDNIVKYENTFFDKHNVDLTLLYTQQKNMTYSQKSGAKGFDDDALGSNRLQAGATQEVATGASDNMNVGKMARLTYSYDRKYAITGTIRQDGYSAFSANNKYVDNSSIGVNWNVTNENFMKNVAWINNLAIRASYGTNGNLSIAPYSTLAKMSNNYYIFQGDANYTYTQKIGSLGNDFLKPETLTGINAGIDFSFLNNRISGSIDGYLTRTNNMTFTLDLPDITGFSSITANAGEVQNRGIEFSLNTVNMKRDKFTWTSNLAFSLNRNKVTRLLGDRDGNGVEDDIVSSGLFIGKPLGAVYSYKVIGMWQQKDVDDETIMKTFAPGTYKLLDVDEDGKITSDKDRVFLGNSNANFRWSLANTFSYGNLSLLVYLNSIWGGNGWFISGNNTPWADGYANRMDLNHPVYDYWTPENPNAEFPRPSYKTLPMAKAAKYYDRSFIRLQKIALSYTLDKYTKRFGVPTCNISISADNLATFAPHWIGLDPATNSGLKDTAIPSLRSYTMKLNISF